MRISRVWGWGFSKTRGTFRGDIGDCQNYGPFLGPHYNTGPNTGPNLGTQKGTIILTIPHIGIRHGHLLGNWDLQGLGLPEIRSAFLWVSVIRSIVSRGLSCLLFVWKLPNCMRTCLPGSGTRVSRSSVYWCSLLVQKS